MSVTFVSLTKSLNAKRCRSLQFRNANILRKCAYDENHKLHYLLIAPSQTALVHLYNAPVSLVFWIYRHSSWLTFHLHDKAAWRCCNTAICIVSFYVWVQTRSTRARCLPIIVTALLHLFPLSLPAPAFHCSRVQICMCARATRVCFGPKRACTSRWIVLENSYPPIVEHSPTKRISHRAKWAFNYPQFRPTYVMIMALLFWLRSRRMTSQKFISSREKSAI